MNDPICAVCGETRVGELLMYSPGVCLCGRCNEIAAHAFIKMHAGKKLREDLQERCIMCGKVVHPSRLNRVQGKYGGPPDKLCPDCLKKYKLEKAEEATQIHIADLSIENNRLRTKLKDLEKEHSDFLDGCFWLSWSLLGAGVVAGMLLSYFLIK